MPLKWKQCLMSLPTEMVQLLTIVANQNCAAAPNNVIYLQKSIHFTLLALSEGKMSLDLWPL